MTAGGTPNPARFQFLDQVSNLNPTLERGVEFNVPPLPQAVAAALEAGRPTLTETWVIAGQHRFAVGSTAFLLVRLARPHSRYSGHHQVFHAGGAAGFRLPGPERVAADDSHSPGPCRFQP